MNEEMWKRMLKKFMMFKAPKVFSNLRKIKSFTFEIGIIKLSCIFILIFVNRNLDAQSIEFVSKNNNTLIMNNLGESRVKYPHNDLIEHNHTKLQQILTDKGYFFSTIDSLSPETIDGKLIVYGELGPVSILRDISFYPIDPWKSLLGSSDTKHFKAQIFSGETVDGLAIKFLDQGVKHGYPFLKLEPKITFKFNAHSDTIFVNIQFSVLDTQSVELTGLLVSGNELISKEMVAKAGKFPIPSAYSIQTAESIFKRLKKHDLIVPQREPEFIQVSDEQFQWYLEMKENPINRFDGILGYFPSNKPTEDGYFAGSVDATFRNFLGKLRKLDISWKKENRTNQEIFIQYTEPYLFDEYLELKTSFYQRNLDSTFLKKSIQLGFHWELFENLTIGGKGEVEFVVAIMNQLSGVPNFQISNTDKYLVGSEILFDTKNKRQNPTNGQYLTLSWMGGVKSVHSLDSTQSTQNEFISSTKMDFWNYISIYSRHLLVNRVLFQSMNIKSVDIQDFFYLGGTSTLRGYREKQLFGEHVGLVSTEYRYLLSETSYVFGLFDIGWIIRSKIENLGIQSEKTLYPALGGGMVLDSPIGQFKVIYALGKGDTFSTGKIHFGLQNEF